MLAVGTFCPGFSHKLWHFVQSVPDSPAHRTRQKLLNRSKKPRGDRTACRILRTRQRLLERSAKSNE